MAELEEETRRLLQMPVKDEKDTERLAELGVPEELRSNAMLLVSALLKKAKEGDTSAFKEMRTLIDRKEEQEPQEGNGMLADLIKGLMEGG